MYLQEVKRQDLMPYRAKFIPSWTYQSAWLCISLYIYETAKNYVVSQWHETEVIFCLLFDASRCKFGHGTLSILSILGQIIVSEVGRSRPSSTESAILYLLWIRQRNKAGYKVLFCASVMQLCIASTLNQIPFLHTIYHSIWSNAHAVSVKGIICHLILLKG